MSNIEKLGMFKRGGNPLVPHPRNKIKAVATVSVLEILYLEYWQQAHQKNVETYQERSDQAGFEPTTIRSPALAHSATQCWMFICQFYTIIPIPHH